VGTVTNGRGVRYVGHAAPMERHGQIFNHFQNNGSKAL